VLDVDENGALSHVDASPFDAPDGGNVDTPQLLNNETVLTANDESDRLYVYLIDDQTGRLTGVAGSPFDSGDTFTSRADPSGTRLYVPNGDDRTIIVYEFDDVTGIPSEIPGSPFTTGATHDNINGMAFTPDGSRLYMGNYGTGEILAFDVSNAGALTSITGSPFPVADVNGMSSLGVTRDAAFLVVIFDRNDEIGVYSITSDAGAPVQVPGSPFSFDIGSATGLVIGE